MIAGVVATLSDDARHSNATIGAMKSSPNMEVGEFTETSRRIPITIDSADQDEMEAMTRWLQDRPGVLFVDVVFVHFEESEAVAHTVADSPIHESHERI